MKQIKRKKLPAALMTALGAGVLLAVTGAHAQQAQRVEKIEVTGTNIKRTDTETPSVVQVITREQIERSGATSVAELLREVPAISGGSLQDFDRGTGFNSANQTASLRGLGSVATLVLLNGRRMAAAPTADPNSGQGTAFNLNTIPISAIERIDILKDGASAIYGSDAIAGVINIILRKDYRGAEAAWSHWQKLDNFSEGNFQVDQITGTIGFGDLTRDRYNVLLAAEFYKRDPVWVRDGGSGIRNDDYRRLAGRNPLVQSASSSAFTSPPNYRREGTPGSGLFNVRLPIDPRCPTANQFTPAGSTVPECRINAFDFVQLISEAERGGLLARGTMQLTSNVTAFLEGGYTKTENTFLLTPPTLGDTPSIWFNRAGQRFSYTLILPVGHPDNPTNTRVGLRYRFLDLGISTVSVEQEVARLVGGLNGTWGPWDWETAVMYNSNDYAVRRNDRLHFPTLLAAVNNGTYRFGSSNNPQALLDALHPTISQDGESKVTSWDLKATRELMSLRGGPVALAAGVEIRKEDMELVSDPRLVAGDFIGLASSGMKGDRTVWSLYGELSIPILRNLETQVALRTDHYSDFGYATTPKIGFKWTPIPTLAARATWAEGFRAPSIFQISTAQVQGFFNGVADPLRCPNPPTPLPGGVAEDCSRSVSGLISANPNLRPEKSTSNTAGIIWSPTSNHSVSIDRWYVHRRDFIDFFDVTTVLRNETDPRFAGQVLRDPNPQNWIPGIPNSGPLQSVLLNFANFGDQVVRGWDVDARFKWPLGAAGRLGLDISATYYDKLLWQIDRGAAYVSGLGNFYFYESPRFKGQATATWSRGPFEVLARVNHVGSWYYGEPTNLVQRTVQTPLTCYLGPTSATLAFLGRCYVESWETYDVGLTWTGIRNLKLGVLVRNVFDKAAPYDPNQGTRGFNPTHHNPYGRYAQFSVSYKFR